MECKFGCSRTSTVALAAAAAAVEVVAIVVKSRSTDIIQNNTKHTNKCDTMRLMTKQLSEAIP